MFIIPDTVFAWIGCQGEINTKRSGESLFSLSHVLRVVLQTVGLICPLLSILHYTAAAATVAYP